MRRDASQLFLARSDRSSFSICVVSLGVTSWSLIEIFNFDFHMAQTVIVISIRSLSESLLVSASSVRAAVPLISPRVMSGQFLLRL
jgi:hypothetical protein